MVVVVECWIFVSGTLLPPHAFDMASCPVFRLWLWLPRSTHPSEVSAASHRKKQKCWRIIVSPCDPDRSIDAGHIRNDDDDDDEPGV
jgi:hypothetical protein